ncbi:MAG: hypothetical protein KAG14_03065 [Mycoplasmataceae bacterium]|nr:hypothetical protein [Mycoplasmataceae bacterium]
MKIIKKFIGFGIGIATLSTVVGVSFIFRHKESTVLNKYPEVSKYAYESIVSKESNKALILITGGPRPMINKRANADRGYGYNTYVLNQGHESDYLNSIWGRELNIIPNISTSSHSHQSFRNSFKKWLSPHISKSKINDILNYLLNGTSSNVGVDDQFFVDEKNKLNPLNNHSEDMWIREMQYRFMTMFLGHDDFQQLLRKAARGFIEKSMSNLNSLIDILKKEGKKVVIQGGSWGGIMINYLVAHHPEIVKKVNGISDLVSWFISDKVSLNFVKTMNYPYNLRTIGVTSEKVKRMFLSDYLTPKATNENRRFISNKLTSEWTDIENATYKKMISKFILSNKNVANLSNILPSIILSGAMSGPGLKSLNNDNNKTLFGILKKQIKDDPSYLNFLKNNWKTLQGGNDNKIGLFLPQVKKLFSENHIVSLYKKNLDHVAVFDAKINGCILNGMFTHPKDRITTSGLPKEGWYGAEDDKYATMDPDIEIAV